MPGTSIGLHLQVSLSPSFHHQCSKIQLVAGCRPTYPHSACRTWCLVIASVPHVQIALWQNRACQGNPHNDVKACIINVLVVLRLGTRCDLRLMWDILKPTQCMMQSGQIQVALQEWYRRLPWACRYVMGTCCAAHITSTLLLGSSGIPKRVCLSVHTTLYRAQLHRLVLAPLFHSSVLHLLVNMAAFAILAPALEAAMGSIRFGCGLALHCLFYLVYHCIELQAVEKWAAPCLGRRSLCALPHVPCFAPRGIVVWRHFPCQWCRQHCCRHAVLLLTLLQAAVYLAACVALQDTGAQANAKSACAVGFSGTLFALLVVSVAQHPASRHSVLGIVNLPARWVPLVVLALSQLLMPTASLVGHVAGTPQPLRT